ncbi:alpha-glycosidase [Paenibacillus spiritus]|uniref:Alpha-glycosidase n=1 Tax=Paenibacillus spiritus TaxID=2496557 RepID=A0A5J5GFR7_9BACL|nr:alpha-glycosidase [Paenibacillus spiritus]KAA9006543.1 alpha-glycosidase [Paenibacillus spiritus]
MQKEALYHIPGYKWAYAYDTETVRLRVRTKRGDVSRVVAQWGDKYDWDRFHDETALEIVTSDELFDYWEAAVSPFYRRMSYIFRLESEEETLYMTDRGIVEEFPEPSGSYYEFAYIHDVDLFKVPQWAKEAVFMQIMPERFANGDPSNDPEGTEDWGGVPTRENFFGGDLQGVIDHLDYLEDLGVNAIYFTPIFESPSNHKYDIVDYKKIDPHFGDTELLKKLIGACHDRGIRVVLDAVFNHCSTEFPAFKDVRENGEASVYQDWFHVRSFPVEVKDGIPSYDTFGFFEEMPKFNTAHPDVKNYLLEVAEYWIKEVGIDGWRLDVANEIDHAFWRDFRNVVKSINPEAYIIGEVWSDSLTWLTGDQFDSVMNYPFSDTVLSYFNGEMNSLDFSNKIGALLMRYPQQTNEVIFNLLCSHDTPRLLTRLGGDKRKMKLAVTFLMTFIGTPCLFYGDEIGLEGEGDPDCRQCMEWDPEKQDRDLHDFYRMVIRLRREHPALRSSRYRIHQACADTPCFVYERSEGNEQFLIWMNNSDEEQTLSLPDLAEGWKDAFSGEEVAGGEDGLSVTLEPFGFRILHREVQNA